MLEGVPISFQCLGHTITVVWEDELLADDGDEVWGLCDYTSNTIQLVKPRPGIDPEIIRQTFWHEAMHYFCHLLNRFDLKDDEAFIDLMASAIHQTLKSAKYPRARGRAIVKKHARKR